jgi:AmpD protein
MLKSRIKFSMDNKTLENKNNTQCRNGLLNNALFVGSLNFNLRPDPEDISLLVIHCASLPEGEFDNDNLEQLFAGTINHKQLTQLLLPPDLQVSTHVYINRNGLVKQFVAFDKRAWHAGVSVYNGISNCNDFSIGIELQGTIYTEFTEAQYDALVAVTKAILNAYPKITKDRIVGHSDIAPVRKTDPGKMFNWNYYLSKL